MLDHDHVAVARVVRLLACLLTLGIVKALSFMFEYIGEMAKDYIYAVAPLLEDALMDRDLVHRQVSVPAVMAHKSQHRVLQKYLRPISEEVSIFRLPLRLRPEILPQDKEATRLLSPSMEGKTVSFRRHRRWTAC